jgi:hypothetical protein
MEGRGIAVTLYQVPAIEESCFVMQGVEELICTSAALQIICCTIFPKASRILH